MCVRPESAPRPAEGFVRRVKPTIKLTGARHNVSEIGKKYAAGPTRSPRAGPPSAALPVALEPSALPPSATPKRLQTGSCGGASGGREIAPSKARGRDPAVRGACNIPKLEPRRRRKLPEKASARLDCKVSVRMRSRALAGRVGPRGSRGGRGCTARRVARAQNEVGQ